MNFENRSTFAEVMIKSRVYCFLRHQVIYVAVAVITGFSVLKLLSFSDDFLQSSRMIYVVR